MKLKPTIFTPIIHDEIHDIVVNNLRFGLFAMSLQGHHSSPYSSLACSGCLSLDFIL